MGAPLFSTEALIIAQRGEPSVAMSAAQSVSCAAPMPRTDWDNIDASDHLLQLYAEAHLLDAVGRFHGHRTHGW